MPVSLMSCERLILRSNAVQGGTADFVSQQALLDSSQFTLYRMSKPAISQLEYVMLLLHVSVPDEVFSGEPILRRKE